MLYRYRGNLNFELVKACLSPHEGKPAEDRPSLSNSSNYACHFRGMRTNGKFRSPYGVRAQTDCPPFYTRRPEAVGLMLLKRRVRQQPVPEPAVTRTPSARPERPRPPVPPPQFDDTPLPSARPHRFNPVLASGLAAIAIALVAGLSIGRSGVFKLKDGTQFAASSQTEPVPPQTGAALSASSGISSAGGDAVAAVERPSEPAAVQAIAPIQPAPVPAENARQLTASRELTSPLPKKPAEQARKPTRAAAPSPAVAETAASSTRTVKKKRKKAPAPEAPKAPKADPFDNVPSYRAQAEPSVRSRFAECSRLDSLLERERCKWKICGHRWGRDGCPKYDHGPATVQNSASSQVAELSTKASKPGQSRAEVRVPPGAIRVRIEELSTPVRPRQLVGSGE